MSKKAKTTNTVTRTLMNLEVVNLSSWAREFKDQPMESGKTRIQALPIKTQWAFVKNMKILDAETQKFEEFRDGLIEQLRAEYFNEERSVEGKQPQIGENGEVVTDAEGNPVMQDILTVKDEYMDQYREEVEKLNQAINEVATEKNVYTFTFIDVDAIVEDLPDDTEITVDDLNMLTAFTADESEDESDK